MYCSWKHSYYIVNLCSMYSLESFITFWKVRNAIHTNLLSILLREFDWIWKKFFWVPVYILVIGTYTCTTHLLKSVILADNTLLNTKDYISEYTHTHTHTHTHTPHISWFSFIFFYTLLHLVKERHGESEKYRKETFSHDSTSHLLSCVYYILLSCIYYIPVLKSSL